MANENNKTRMENRIQIENILLRFKVVQKTLDESTKAICDLFGVVVPKGTLSNLDEAIKKAKPNMDKIKDVDKHIDSIR